MKTVSGSIKNLIKFFQKLYGDHPTRVRNLPVNNFPRLYSSDILFLNRAISKDEIKTVLFYMAPLKALGSEGFHALFFQS